MKPFFCAKHNSMRIAKVFLENFRNRRATVRYFIYGRLLTIPYAIRQTILGIAFTLSPKRASKIIPLIYVTLRDALYSNQLTLIAPDSAFASASGLCGLANNLDVDRLIAGYKSGMYVFSHIGPLKWWSPPNRAVLFFDKARVEKTTRRLIRSGLFKITFDNAFDRVMLECAKPRDGQLPLTWITPKNQTLFSEAFTKGHAHSVEVWRGEQLVGGLYGLSVGRVFFTESQFHIVRDASKVAFAILNLHLQSWGYALNDGKELTPYLADAGLILITRAELCGVLQTQANLSPSSDAWGINPGLLASAWEPERSSGQKMQDLLSKEPSISVTTDVPIAK